MTLPSLLVAFPFLGPFLRELPTLSIRSWVLDSGAFSALNSGKRIDLQEYVDTCLKLKATPDAPQRVFALDVIGDPEASMRNTEEMVRQGVDAIPTFHLGSPEHYLADIARRFPRIALGGVARRGKGGHGTRFHASQKAKFIEQAMARVWPKWIHGFGCADWKLLQRFPLASADSTTWVYGAQRYGFSSRFGNQTVPRGRAAQAIFIPDEIRFFLGLERDARDRFGKHLERADLEPFQMRFSVGPGQMRWFRKMKGQTCEPY